MNNCRPNKNLKVPLDDSVPSVPKYSCKNESFPTTNAGKFFVGRLSFFFLFNILVLVYILI